MKRKKPVITLEIPKKRENNIMARSGKPKTVNNESPNSHSTLRLRPTTSGNMLTKKVQNRLENAKTDLKPFLTILGTSQRAITNFFVIFDFS